MCRGLAYPPTLSCAIATLVLLMHEESGLEGKAKDYACPVYMCMISSCVCSVYCE